MFLPILLSEKRGEFSDRTRSKLGGVFWKAPPPRGGPTLHAPSRDGNLWHDRRRNRRDETEGVPAPGHEAEWGAGVRVTIKNFVAAAELVKHDQAECFDDFGRPALHPRAAVVFSSARSARRSRFLPTGKNLPFLKSLSVHGTSRERNCPFGFFFSRPI